MLFEERGQVFQMSETARRRRRTPYHFANRLLHWFDAGFHQGKLSRCSGWRSTGDFRLRPGTYAGLGGIVAAGPG